MRIGKKLKDYKGFTLAETLLAVIILLLVSTIVATGMPAAKSAYEKIVVAANAQVLLSTGATALRDELGTAWDVKIEDDGKTVTYYSSDTGGKSQVLLNSTDQDKIYIQEYVKNDYLNLVEGTSVGEKRLLVSDKAANGDLVITYEGIEQDSEDNPTSVVITGLIVKNGEGREMASLGSDLTIPVFSFAPTSAS